MYDDGMTLVGRWWNGVWSRHTRRDIWLYAADGGWLVRIRAGHSDSETAEELLQSEADARALVAELIAAEHAPSEWKELTSLYRPTP